MTKEDLRIVFFGTSDFGCPTLDTLRINGFNVVGVVTKPDFFNPRKKVLEPTPIKQKAIELGIPVLEAKDMNSKDFQAHLGAFSGNIFIVIAFQMIPKAVYSMAKYGTFNIHASLLPLYRGAAPINWAIANGENRIGMTSFFINEKMDEGDIICQMSVPNYTNKNFTQMYQVLSISVCGGLCCKTLNQIISEDGNTSTFKQDRYGLVENEINRAKSNGEKSKYFAPKLNRQNTKLDLSKGVKDVFNHIKAFSEKPGAWCSIVSDDKYNLRSIKILSGEIISFGSKSNHPEEGFYFTAPDKDSILLWCNDGIIKVKTLQIEGSKVMDAKTFLNGYGNSIENWKLQ